MMIKLKLFSVLAELAGSREIEFNIDDEITISEFILILFEKTTPELKNYIFDEKNEQLRDQIIFVINEHILNREEIKLRLIKNGDTIALLTPAEGG